MATQGIVSIVQSGRTRIKLVAGSNGYTAPQLAQCLRALPGITPQAAFEKAREFGFGGPEDLVVQAGPGEFIAAQGVEELPALYGLKFDDPRFNPRWEGGSADFVEVVIE